MKWINVIMLIILAVVALNFKLDGQTLKHIVWGGVMGGWLTMLYLKS